MVEVVFYYNDTATRTTSQPFPADTYTITVGGATQASSIVSNISNNVNISVPGGTSGTASTNTSYPGGGSGFYTPGITGGTNTSANSVGGTQQTSGQGGGDYSRGTATFYGTYYPTNSTPILNFPNAGFTKSNGQNQENYVSSGGWQSSGTSYGGYGGFAQVVNSGSYMQIDSNSSTSNGGNGQYYGCGGGGASTGTGGNGYRGLVLLWHPTSKMDGP
jgi:hypothetical protein